MKIYSDIITESDVRAAFTSARQENKQDIYIEDIRGWKPRRYACGVEVHAESLAGKRTTGHVPARATGPRDGYPRAASWDAWGYAIAYLYNLDPHARIGIYDNEADFVEKVRKYRHKDSELPFLDVLDNIKEYAE
jgi:hypothetical protein